MAKKAKTAGRKSAPPRESEARQRSRTDAQAKTGRAKTSSKIGTESETEKRSIAEHSEHPENPTDSTVRHAVGTDAAGQEGQKGFPQGEYDVTPPAKEGRKTGAEGAIEQHIGSADVEQIKKAIAAPQANRMTAEKRSLALEALPVGSILEHEGQNRWRVRGPISGGIRWGHGATAQEAIESYVLGLAVQDSAAAGAQAFSQLSPQIQKEITERDRIAAQRVGQSPDGTPEAIARREFQENQKAARKAKPAAANASTDGPEIASAQLEAGQKRASARKRSGATKRPSGRKRTK